jgi:hypothetical protein
MRCARSKKQCRETENVAMIPISYRPAPAGWLVVHGSDTLLCLDWSTPGDIDALWIALNNENAVQSVLDLLTQSGLSRTPSFALVVHGGSESRVIARGAVVALTDDAGKHTMDATGITTWKEEIWGKPSALSISWNQPSSDAGLLPIGFGAAFAHSVESRAADGFAAPPVPIAATAKSSAPRAAAPTERPVQVDPAPIAVATDAVAEAGSGETAIADEVPVAGSRDSHSAGEVKLPEATMVSFEPEHHDDHATGSEQVVEADSASATVEAGEDAESEDDADYSFLFGHTVMRSVEDAAHREPDEDEDEGADESSAKASGDHDGHTVHIGDIAKLRSQRAKAAKPSGPKYFVEISTGGQAELDGPVIIGRSPSSSKVSGGDIPQLVSLSGVQDISRNHVQFTVEGDTVVVTDLHSRNGTSITLPGKSPQSLRAGEPAVVLAGTVVDLGGVTLTVKER